MIDLGPPPLWLPPRPAIIRVGQIEKAPLPLGAMLPGMVPVITGSAAAEWVTAVGPIGLNADETGSWSGFTIVVSIDDAQVAETGGSKVRVTLSGPSTGSVTLAGVYIGHAASSGSVSFNTTPVQLLLSGSSTWSALGNADYVSDEATFRITPGSDLLIAYYESAGGAPRKLSTLTGFKSYYKSGNDAATVTKSGYTERTTSNVMTLKQIEVFK